MNSIKSYKEYLKTFETGKSTDEMKKEGEAQIEVEFDKSASTYGANAEQLAQSGLTASGYATFLDDRAKKTKLAKLDELTEEVAEEENARRRAYSDYLRKQTSAQATIRRRVHSSIISSGTTSQQLALDIAASYGLTDEEALQIATNAVAVNVDKRKMEIMTYIRTQQISPERAVMYGESYGLPEEALEEIREYASKLLYYSPGYNFEDVLNTYKNANS